MAVNDFVHSIPNNTGNKVREEEPDRSYSTPDVCGISTHRGTLYVVDCDEPGSVIVDSAVNSSTVSTTTLTATTGTIDNLTSTNATLTGTINQQAWKGFDIPHPNKENHRLRHICLEGPEAGVYIRGKGKGKIIKIPDYWKGLIDEDSISVHLTPYGNSYVLFVEKIEDNKIYIESNWEVSGTDIEYYYIINASRIDGEKLIIEYEGNTPADYPGSPDQFSISGYDYGRN